MFQKNPLWFILFGAAFLGTGCTKNPASESPQDQLTVSRVFADDAGALSAMTGYYISVMNLKQGLLNGNISLDAGLSADELTCTQPVPAADSFQLNILTPENEENTELFKEAYHLLYGLNSLLAGVQGSATLSVPVSNQLTGEAKLNRALLYFYLVNLYGDVPLVLGTDYRQNERLPRRPQDSVYARMLSDLADAIALLPADYPTPDTGQYAGSRARPCKAAALALLARVRLYRGQWAAAESAATAVIGDARFRLEADPGKVFLASSQEAIWQLQPVNGTIATGDVYLFLFPQQGGRPPYILDTGLLHSFEPGDLRVGRWIQQRPYGGGVFVPFKYKQLSATVGNTEYEVVLRLAEQYLIRAEARVREGDLPGAMADVNMIRTRAGLAGIPARDAGSLLAAIRQERRVELFSEWGHRWLDLKRWSAADSVLAARKSWWQSHDALYPVPSAELVVNAGMPQNPGY
jgi:hypothetical protein